MNEVLIGLGLLVLWVYIDEDKAYLLITRCKEKTRRLLFMIGLVSHGEIDKCSVRSLDQVQLNLFDRQIGGFLGTNVYQYCMVLFLHKSNGGEEWVPRSLFLYEGHLIVCIEDILHFSSLPGHADSTLYFLPDSCCSIADLSEMVIEANESQCVTLTLRKGSRVPCLSSIIERMKLKIGFQNRSTTSRSRTWKLKWFSAESLCKFVTLLKAIHRGTASPTLSTTYIS